MMRETGTNASRSKTFLQYDEMSGPAIASRKMSLPYLNGRYGTMLWNGAGKTSTGNVPPEPATCKTSMITDNALPITLKVIVSE